MLDLLLGFPSRCWTPRLLGLLARALARTWTLAALPGPAWALLDAPSPLGLLPRPCRALGLAELAAGPGLLPRLCCPGLPARAPCCFGLFVARARAYSVQSSAVLGLARPSLAPVGLPITLIHLDQTSPL